MEFNRSLRSGRDLYNLDTVFSIGAMDNYLSTQDVYRLKKYREAWNFYEGYHWEDVSQVDKPQVTENYCRPFVNKFVSFELGKGFTISYANPDVMNINISKEGQAEMSPLEFLNSVWKTNNKDQLCLELGQMKSITGDAWIQVSFIKPEDLDDPFNEFPNGKIRITVVPTNIVFPEYDDHDKSKILKLTVMYPISKKNVSPVLRRERISEVVYRAVWTKDEVVEYEGQEVIRRVKNPYKMIPFVQIKNFPTAGKETGVGDLDDLIPMNVELNLKKSDISEIIDYHSAPITIVYGARVGNLEKGANKVWGGLPKDAKVENLQLQGNLTASVSYIEELKSAMHEVGGVPKGALGGTQAISNTSGVALQFVNMPLIERTENKIVCTQHGLQLVNKMILKIALVEGLITFQETEQVKYFDLYDSEVKVKSTLPKDTLIELQELQLELAMGLESKEGAMTRLNKENVAQLKAQIEEDQRKEEEKLLSLATKQEEQQAQINSGMTNGETNIELLRKENQGANMPQNADL